MAVAATGELWNRYLQVVRASRLVEESALVKVLADIDHELAAVSPDRAKIERLAAALVARQLLTEWQAKQLSDGKSKGYFLGNYKLLRHLGTGGMSSVFLAEHTKMLRCAAIKILPRDRVSDRSYLDRFLQEARAIAQLDHPNIVQAFGVDNEGSTYYLAMQYVEGKDLERTVQEHGPVDVPAAVNYIAQAAEGLAHAHARGMVHRDIKPSNLLVDLQGTIKILDLGLARLELPDAQSLTLEHRENVIGTADYMAPEQAIDSHQVDARADIYSLGGTLYFLLTGRPPFPTGTLAQRIMKHQTQEPQPIGELRPGVAPEVVELCRAMMIKKRDGRIASASEVVERATAWLVSQGHAAPNAGRRGPIVRSAKAIASDEATEGEAASQSFFLNRPASAIRRARPTSIWNSPIILGGTVLACGIALLAALASMLGMFGPAGDNPLPLAAREALPGTGGQATSGTRPSKSAAVQPIAALRTSAGQPTSPGSSETRLVFDWPEAERSGAKLRIGDQTVAVPLQGRAVFPLAPGKHEVAIERPGYRDFKISVTLRAGQEKEIAPWFQTITREDSPATTGPQPGQPLASSGRPAFSVLIASGGTVTFYTDEAEWLAHVEAVEYAWPAAEFIAKSREVQEPPAHRAKIGSTLTWDAAATGLSQTLRLTSLESGATMAFENTRDAGPQLWVGSTEDKENNDWRLEVLDGGSWTACGFYVGHNTDLREEQIEVFAADGSLLATLPSSQLVSSEGSVFYGVVSTQPFVAVRYDEDPRGDDIRIGGFCFGKAK